MSLVMTGRSQATRTYTQLINVNSGPQFRETRPQGISFLLDVRLPQMISSLNQTQSVGQ